MTKENKPIIIVKNDFFKNHQQIDWHLRTHGHLPSECGSKHAILDCPWQDRNKQNNMTNQEISFCSFCKAEKSVLRQYLYAKNKPKVGDGFAFIYYCDECGLKESVITDTTNQNKGWEERFEALFVPANKKGDISMERFLRIIRGQKLFIREMIEKIKSCHK